MDLLSAAVVVVGINVPFGYWRANVRKLSFPWFLAVHAPVPLVIAVRLLSGLGWHFITFPVLIGAFLCGQLLGGRLHRLRGRQAAMPVTSCLVWDLVQDCKARSRC